MIQKMLDLNFNSSALRVILKLETGLDTVSVN